MCFLFHPKIHSEASRRIYPQCNLPCRHPIVKLGAFLCNGLCTSQGHQQAKKLCSWTGRCLLDVKELETSSNMDHGHDMNIENVLPHLQRTCLTNMLQNTMTNCLKSGAPTPAAPPTGAVRSRPKGCEGNFGLPKNHCGKHCP